MLDIVDNWKEQEIIDAHIDLLLSFEKGRPLMYSLWLSFDSETLYLILLMYWIQNYTF